MKMLVMGWVRRSGKRKSDGANFDFAQVIGTSPVEEVAGDKFTSVGAGFQEMTIPLEKGSEVEFKGLKFPCVLELKMDHRVGPRGNIEPVCVGATRSAAVSAA